MYYVGGAAGYAEFYIDGVKVYTKRGGLAQGPAPALGRRHLPDQLRRDRARARPPRIHYISNLSVGKK